MTDESLLLVERPIEGVVVLTLNRPRAMNALSLALREALTSAFRGLAGDTTARVVVVTGAGAAFCAGLDLKELATQAGATDAVYDGDLISAMSAFGGPIIGAVNGAAITGGFELALACDILIASTQAKFADTHARVGVMPGWGLSQKLSRMIGLARAKELSFTGNFLDARRAHAWGLVNRVVEPQALMPEALALARDMLSTVPETLIAYKRVIDEGFAMSLREGLALEATTAKASARNLDPVAIEHRREAVRRRGRGQLGHGRPVGEASDGK